METRDAGVQPGSELRVTVGHLPWRVSSGAARQDQTRRSRATREALKPGARTDDQTRIESTPASSRPLTPTGATPIKASSWRALLRVPLLSKLAGANLLIALVTFAVTALAVPREAESAVLLIIGGALATSVATNVALVWLALRPLAGLEATAARIWSGDTTARVPISPLADRQIERVGEALNLLLDKVDEDQLRIRELAAGVMRVADEERAEIAHELHDSSAQSLAALQMELSVVARETVDRSASERLERLRRIAGDVLDEVRLLAQAVHPQVMDDLGLGAALRRLAREAERSGSWHVELDVDNSVADLDPSVASVLYRVAQEALTNAVRHAGAGTVHVAVGSNGDFARLEVRDDGVGFYPGDVARRSSGEGLSNMRARLALLDGTLEVESALGRGTSVRARVPRRARTRSVAPGR